MIRHRTFISDEKPFRIVTAARPRVHAPMLNLNVQVTLMQAEQRLRPEGLLPRFRVSISFRHGFSSCRACPHPQHGESPVHVAVGGLPIVYRADTGHRTWMVRRLKHASKQCIQMPSSARAGEPVAPVPATGRTVRVEATSCPMVHGHGHSEERMVQAFAGKTCVSF